MLFYRVANHPCISEACGDSVISIGPIARDIDQTGERWGLESRLPYILVKAREGKHRKLLEPSSWNPEWTAAIFCLLIQPSDFCDSLDAL